MESTCSSSDDNDIKPTNGLNNDIVNLEWEKLDGRKQTVSIRLSNVGCIGAGYVGGITMSVLASCCPHLKVYVVDSNVDKIAQWKSEKLPIFEPGLEPLVKKCRNRNLFFTHDFSKVISECDIIFITVGTPPRQDLNCESSEVPQQQLIDFSFYEEAARTIALHSNSFKILVEKSTVPVKTAKHIYELLMSQSLNKKVADYVILSNPEFLSAGSAVYDATNPERILIGFWNNHPLAQVALTILSDIYKHWVSESRILQTSLWSSELAKLASNAFLAQRVSSINAVSQLCEKTGADVREVVKVIGSDSRLGNKFLNASAGFGGSCFQKDVLCLAYLCESYGLDEAAMYWKAVIQMNENQKFRFAQKIIYRLKGVENKKIALLGFTFKANTDDIRNSVAITVCRHLITRGANIHMHDPKVNGVEAVKALRTEFDRHNLSLAHDVFIVQKDVCSAVEDSNAIVFLTDWAEFKSLDFIQLYSIMRRPSFIFDGKNMFSDQLEKFLKIGFQVDGVGISMLSETGF